MSKAPIRSAMMRLRQEGLIVSRGRQGNAVSPVTLRDIQEIFQLRLVLDVTAVRLAAGKVDAARLRALNEAAHAAYPAGDKAGQAAYLRANREFHRYVAESTGNQRLVTLVVGLMEQHERIVHLGLAMQRREHEFHHFHDDLVTALIDGDGERAAQLTETALRGSQRKVMEALTDSTAQVSLPRMDLEPFPFVRKRSEISLTAVGLRPRLAREVTPHTAVAACRASVHDGRAPTSKFSRHGYGLWRYLIRAQAH